MNDYLLNLACNNEEKLLIARLHELVQKAAHEVCGQSDFMDLHQQELAAAVAVNGSAIGWQFNGGYESIELHIDKELIVDEQSKLNSIPITIYNFDHTLAPEGKTCMRVMLKTDNYHHWHDLRINKKEEYKQEKDRIAKEVVKILDKCFGNIINNVDMIDVATPTTFQRYTNNWMGSTQSWVWLPSLIPEFIKKELPGLKKFLFNRPMDCAWRRCIYCFSIWSRYNANYL